MWAQDAKTEPTTYGEGNDGFWGFALLQLFGVAPSTETVYRAMLARPRAGVAALARHVGMTPTEVGAELDKLAELMLIRSDPGRSTYTAVAPDVAIEQLLSQQEERLAELEAKVRSSRHAVTGYVDSFLESRVQRDNLGLVELIDDPTLVRSRLYQLVRSAQQSCTTVLPGEALPTEAIEPSTRFDAELLSRKVTVRSVVSGASLNSPIWLEHLQRQTDLGVQVRVHTNPGLQLIVVDGSIAILPRQQSPGALIVHGPDLVAPIELLVRTTWEQAEPFERPAAAESGPERFSEARLRQVVALLAQGHKDETIARRLGISVRTVRRLVSAAVDELHADSRFQAGVEAVRQGWVS